MQHPPIAEPEIHATARRLRRDATEAEKALWAMLRDDALGVRFRRQHPIPPHFADFACVLLKLVIEVDGGRHGGAADAVRDATLAARGWRMLRYWNNDVLSNRDGVATDIRRVVVELIAARG
jgi:very-short-patch-repair endonuclease